LFLIPTTFDFANDAGTGPELNISWQDTGTGHEIHPSTEFGAGEKTRKYFQYLTTDYTDCTDEDAKN